MGTDLSQFSVHWNLDSGGHLQAETREKYSFWKVLRDGGAVFADTTVGHGARKGQKVAKPGT